MKKILKTLNFRVVFVILFAFFALAQNETIYTSSVSAAEPILEQTAVSAQSGQGIDKIQLSTKNKVFNKADSQSADQNANLKNKLIKFLTALFGVIVSSLTIFFVLKLYKKFGLKGNSDGANIDYSKTLESPKDFKDAINLFLDKTDKE